MSQLIDSKILLGHLKGRGVDKFLISFLKAGFTFAIFHLEGNFFRVIALLITSLSPILNDDDVSFISLLVILS